MTWLAWRQFRAQAFMAVVLLVVSAAVLGVTHSGIVHLFAAVQACNATHSCQAATSLFKARDTQLRNIANAVVVVAPALIGVFWGAPLVARELETGAFRLAWTQSITRSRWMAVKLGIVGVASMVAAGLLSLMVTWWSSQSDQLANNPFQEFDTRGIVQIGYAAFGFALGVAAGTLFRRTLPAMAATLVAFFAVRLSFSTWARQYILPPLHSSTPLMMTPTGFVLPGPPNPADWLISNRIVTGSGRGVNQLLLGQFQVQRSGTLFFRGMGACPIKVPASSLHTGNVPQSVLSSCLASFHLHLIVTYQPENRYWTFQWIELLVFLCLALLLAGVSARWVRRRLA